jgi:hypothetical protein
MEVRHVVGRMDVVKRVRRRERVVRPVLVRVAVEQQHRLLERSRMPGDAGNDRLVGRKVRRSLAVQVPHVGLDADHDRFDAVGLRLRERSIEPADVGARPRRDLLRLRRALGRRLVPDVVVVIRAARHVDRHEEHLRLLPHHVLDVVRVRRVRRVEALRLGQHLLVPPAEGVARVGEEDRPDQVEVRDRVAPGVVDGVAAAVEDVVDLQGDRVVEAATLCGLVAVGPLVVAGRVDERVLVGRPQVEDSLVVGLRAVLLARVDVADVEHEVDLRIGVDRVDEGGCRLELGRVRRRRSVGRVAVDRHREHVGRAGIDRRAVPRRRRKRDRECHSARTNERNELLQDALP